MVPARPSTSLALASHCSSFKSSCTDCCLLCGLLAWLPAATNYLLRTTYSVPYLVLTGDCVPPTTYTRCPSLVGYYCISAVHNYALLTQIFSCRSGCRICCAAPPRWCLCGGTLPKPTRTISTPAAGRTSLPITTTVGRTSTQALTRYPLQLNHTTEPHDTPRFHSMVGAPAPASRIWWLRWRHRLPLLASSS